MSFDNNLEGYNACQTMWFRFWNPQVGNFSTNIPCHESRGHNFSMYAQAVAIHAIADSVNVYKDATLPIVDKAIKSCLKYRNPKRGAYSVEFHGGINSGDDDICYDDNAHLLRAFISAYEGTANENYLTMSREIMEFMYTGIISHKIWGIKGLIWHVTKPYMNTISNSVAAIGAMKMIKYARSKEEEKKLYEFAKICVIFIWEKMRDADNILMDGVGWDSEILDKTKYTYNQGATLNALCQLYKYDKDPQWADKAKLLAEAATDRGKTIFDRDYDDWGKRYWHGSTYFGQLLIEGLVEYVDICGSVGPPGSLNCCKEEIRRHLSYMRKYVYDPQDNVYFGSFDIYTLDDNVYKRYRNEFGGHKPFKPDARERAGGMDDRPIEKRPIAKSLICQGAAAHSFFQGARIWPKMDPADV